VRRRGRRQFRAKLVPEEASSGIRAYVLSQVGHVLNLEEPALFNEAVERFLALAEANRWGSRDPRSVLS
jgi:hypothetical protein